MTRVLNFTPYTESVAGSSGTPIDLVFESGKSDIWSESTDGDVALPPGNPDGNSNYIGWNPSGAAATGGKTYTLDGDSVERGFEIRVEDPGGNVYIEFDPVQLAANFDKVVILDAAAPAFPPGQPLAASGANATLNLLTESRTGAYTLYPGYFEFTTGNTGQKRIGIVSSLQYFIQIKPKVTAPAGDLTAPVINLNGPSSSNHEVGPAYTDTAAASDNSDGDITSSITTTITKDGAAFNDDVATIGYVPGTYVITYNVSDAAGNQAAQVSKTVTVADTLDPDMVLQGASTITLTVGQSYIDAGVTSNDNYDQSPTISITITKNGAAFNDDITTIGNAVGTYIITYNASDGAGNTAQETRTRTVNVEAAPADTTAPVISLTGVSTITLTVGEAYTEYGATATDTVDGTVTVTIGGDTVNTGAVGTYIITYNASDVAGNTAQETRTVNVEAAPADTTAPVISLTGESTITLTVGEAYTEYGATATDTVDGTVTVTIGGDTVNTGAVGTYTLTYSASDVAGNTATPVTRTVTVEAAPVTDTTDPVITLTGASTITLTVGQTYTEAGATATDDTDASVVVTVSGSVNTTLAGTYNITYNATDAAGNTATQVTRTVTVEAANDTTWGDINNDGSVGAADVVYLASYLAGESGFIHGGPSAPAS